MQPVRGIVFWFRMRTICPPGALADETAMTPRRARRAPLAGRLVAGAGPSPLAGTVRGVSLFAGTVRGASATPGSRFSFAGSSPFFPSRAGAFSSPAPAGDTATRTGGGSLLPPRRDERDGRGAHGGLRGRGARRRRLAERNAPGCH